MNIHKEGYKTIALAIFAFGIINISFFYFFSSSLPVMAWIIFGVTLVLLIFVISFFRSPKRETNAQHHEIVCPADGKIVVIEETPGSEYFNDKRIQISIFMSPTNVHINRYPMSGVVTYNKYHKGKYLVAWHPKSSQENERHSIAIKSDKAEILVRQIAGAMAKRIVNYAKVGMHVEQGKEMGFIKFGSRVDVLLPVGTPLNIHLNQTVKGGITILASIDTHPKVETEPVGEHKMVN